MNFHSGNLVLYKSQSARVVSAAAKIEIELPDGKKVSVRDKDIILLHGGPLNSFADLTQLESSEIEEACALLDGTATTLPELADLIFGVYTPQSAWAVCRLMLDGLYFCGTPDAILVRSVEAINKERQQRASKTAEKEAWNGFIDRLRKSTLIDIDRSRIVPLEDFCLGKNSGCRILKELDVQETPEHAHTLLLKLGIWDHGINPYPSRRGFAEAPAYPALPPLPQEDRLDLTHLCAYAIDDEGNKDPDDALSIDGNILWVHIADVAAAVTPGCPLDIHAGGVGANLYLPENTHTMLPPEATTIFGLGISETSPALSFGIVLNENGSIASYQIHPSLIKVTRITYEAAQERIEQHPFSELYSLTQQYRAFRKSQNGIFLSFPEVKLRVIDGRVTICPLGDLPSRDMVTDAMLMAGEAAARFAMEHVLPFPYTSQPPPETIGHAADMAAMFAYRRQLKPSGVKTIPEAHAGLGLPSYSRVTSPLRRYLDLVAHQQIRLFMTGGKLLDEQAIVSRIGTSAAMTGTLQKIERLSNQHWTLVYLLQNPHWQGRGIVVEIRERYSIVIIPEIAFETRISTDKELSLNQELCLAISSVDLPGLTARFTII